MSPRITINLTAEGEFELWLNEQGRDLLVRELQRLNENNEHFHLMPKYIPGDVAVSSHPYRPDDKVFEWGKVHFRTDAWDKQYYPHVLDETA